MFLHARTDGQTARWQMDAYIVLIVALSSPFRFAAGITSRRLLMAHSKRALLLIAALSLICVIFTKQKTMQFGDAGGHDAPEEERYVCSIIRQI